LKGPFAKELTLRHLSTMTAGLEWDEHYTSPFGITAEAYYTDDIQSVMSKLPITTKPGVAWKYQSGSTQLLSFVLAEALRTPSLRNHTANDTSNLRVPSQALKAYSSISEFGSDVIWKPLGMEASALWSLDHENGQ
jgi:CubicO group peptidase (beta-lactamase class C family)